MNKSQNDTSFGTKCGNVVVDYSKEGEQQHSFSTRSGHQPKSQSSSHQSYGSRAGASRSKHSYNNNTVETSHLTNTTNQLSDNSVSSHTRSWQSHRGSSNKDLQVQSDQPLEQKEVHNSHHSTTKVGGTSQKSSKVSQWFFASHTSDLYRKSDYRLIASSDQ